MRPRSSDVLEKTYEKALLEAAILTVSVRLAPAYSQVFVEDVRGGHAPPTQTTICSSSSSVVIPCLMFADGTTQFTLGTSADVDPGTPVRFEGVLSTPNKRIVVRTVEFETVLEAAVATNETYLRIWTNSEFEPDEVIIGFDG